MKKTCMQSMAAVLLIMLTALPLFAASEAETAAEDEIVTIQYWNWDPSFKGNNEAMIAKFEAENPNIKVEMSSIEPSEYWTKVRILANQGKLPDVFNMSSGYVEEWANSGLMYDLAPLISGSFDTSAFYMNLFDGVKEIAGADSYYAFPYAQVTTNLFFNMDMFDKAGIAYPDEDWTWSDFLDAARKLTKDLDGDGSVDQWGYWFYGRYAHVESWVYSNNGSLIDRGTMSYAPDANALEALRFLTDLVLEEKVAPAPKEMTAFRVQDVFPMGVAAMWVDGSWNIDNNRTVADPAMRWGIAELPIGPNGDGSLTYGWPDSLAMSPTTENAEAAWEFMKFAAGEGLTMDTVMAGKIPSYRGLTESEAFLDAGQLPENKGLLIKQASETMRTSFTKNWGEWRGYGASEALGFNGVIDGIINGEMSFEKGIATADKNINAVLNRVYDK